LNGTGKSSIGWLLPNWKKLRKGRKAVAHIRILDVSSIRKTTTIAHFAGSTITLAMEASSVSGYASPSSSMFSLTSGSTPDVINTPGTDRSCLFDDDVAADPLDIDGQSAPFILVVGGLGYIGSHTTLELLKEGYNVLVVDDLSNSYEDVLDRVSTLATEYCTAHGKHVPALHYRQLDYRSPAMRTVLASYATYTMTTKAEGKTRRPPYSTLQRTDSGIDMDTDEQPESVLERTSRISGVIHFAAYKSVEESIRMPLRYYSNNVCGLVDFLALLEQFGIKNFVFSSSATVYGEGANCGVPLREELCVHQPESYFERDGSERQVLPGVLGLTSPYGRSKFMCESILADVARSDPSWCITALRYFNPVCVDVADSKRNS
jgi:UDP-glucose 4-epimerase